MPVDDAMSFISKNFPSQVGGVVGNNSGSGNSVISKTHSGGPSGHPPDIQKIINFLSDDRPLSIMEFDKMIKYLVSKRTETLREEYGDSIPGHLQHPPVGPNQDPATKAKQESVARNNFRIVVMVHHCVTSSNVCSPVFVLALLVWGIKTIVMPSR